MIQEVVEHVPAEMLVSDGLGRYKGVADAAELGHQICVAI